MKLKLLAAVLAASALPVLAQTGNTATAQPGQARVEVDHGDGATAKSSKPGKAKKSHQKSTKKKSKKHSQAAG
ncbi:MAG TPA: hypothetical protein VFJ62_13400 [Usitatibacter sp.]|nr:hypothetical protein [Usitatibacter sp.]